MKLKNLQVGDRFKLKTNRFYLRHHIYQVIENSGGVVKYAFAGQDQYNQKTTTSGQESVFKQ